MIHPLTEEICRKIITRSTDSIFLNASMRATADWQLAQCLNYIRLTYGDEAMVPFMEAMRPTQENN